MMEGTARKKTRKEKPDATQRYRNTLDSDGCLRNYDILRIIFQYLNARDLGSAAIVCKSWSEAANKEKLVRGPCCQLFTTSESLYNYIENIRIKPSAGFFFIPGIAHNIEDCIEDLLPKHCVALRFIGRGIILDNDEMEKPLVPSIVCAFLPQIPNVRIKSFELAENCVIQNTSEYREIIKTIVDHDTSTSNHETSTCFMLLCNYIIGRTTAKRWASAMQESKEVNIASVWGGVLYSIYIQREMFPRKAPNCVAVLITGSIQTWSTTLDMNCHTKEQIEARLKLFKDEVKLKKHSIGFMFVGIARTVCIESNVTSTIFKRLFPKVSLVGCFGYSVFRKTTVDEVNEEKNDEKEHKCKESKSWYNEFSTVFLIITYG